MCPLQGLGHANGDHQVLGGGQAVRAPSAAWMPNASDQTGGNGATRDRRFRAFDSRTGQELWSTRFDYNVTAIPITFMGRNGKQYVAVVAATQGQGNNESLHVFALPSFAPCATAGKP